MKKQKLINSERELNELVSHFETYELEERLEYGWGCSEPEIVSQDACSTTTVCHCE